MSYKYIECPKEYEALMNCQGLVMEHRLNAAIKYGRLPNKNEVVHHIDRDKLNNHPDNLLIMAKEKHVELHKLRFPKSKKAEHVLPVKKYKYQDGPYKKSKIYPERICLFCKKKFIPKTTWQKFCADQCRNGRWTNERYSIDNKLTEIEQRLTALESRVESLESASK